MSNRLQMLQQLVAQGDTEAFTHYALALEYRSQQRFDDALLAFEKLRGLHPEYVPMYQMAGSMLAELGRDEEASAWLTDGIEQANEQGNSHAVSEMQDVLDSID